MKHTLLLLVASLLISCGAKETTNKSQNSTIDDKECIILDVNSALENEGRYLEDMIDSIYIIPLETTEESLIGGHINNVIVTDNYLFINDICGQFPGLIQFDKNGKFIKRYHQGNGPGEFTDASNILISNGFLYVTAYAGMKINKYTIYGEFVNDIQLHERMFSFLTKVGNEFLLWQDEMQNNEKACKLLRIDSNMVQLSEYTFPKIPTSWGAKGFGKIDDTNCLVYRDFDNDIYNYSNGNLTVKYRLNYPDYQHIIPADKYTHENYKNTEDYFHAMTELFNSVEQGKYLFEGNVVESEDYLSFQMLGNNFKSPTIFYNKNTGNIWKVVEHNYEDKPLFTAYWQHGNINVKGQKNTFWSILSPDYIVYGGIQNINNLLSDKDMEIIKNTDIEDNPIIVIYKLKDNL